MHYVIIGNSAAAVGAIEAIRRIDTKNKVTVISDEQYPAYSRPLITYLLAGKVTEETMLLRSKDFYLQHGVETVFGEEVTTVDFREKKVFLNNSTSIPYDKLLISSGGEPIVPELEGRNQPGVFTFTKWDDVNTVREYMTHVKVNRCCVLGGGLIGLKTTEALIELGLEVTVVELADRVLSATFDQRASDMVAESLKRSGCRLITSDTVTSIKGKNGTVESARLKNGEEIPCEMVILAVGVKPNTGFLQESEIKQERGIIVNRRMETSIPDAYAAGDVTQAPELLSDEYRTIAIWPAASRQGSIAGTNMAGGDKEYEGGLAMNAIEICHLPTISVGQTIPSSPDNEVMECFNEDKFIYKKVILKDNVIVGSIFIGDIERAGIITGLIKNATDVALFKDKLLQDDFGLVWLPRDYRKHLVEGPGVEV